MPRALRNRQSSPPPVEEEVEDEAGQEYEDMEIDGTHELQFDQALTWRAGKPIVVAELLRRLKALHEEVRSIEQQDAHRPSIVPKAQELANQQLLTHRDNGVKAWTILNIVEMFRLLAPDAPYKQSQLKEIFNIIVSHVVPALGRPNDPFTTQHLDILKSLVDIKSILVIQDAPGSERLLLALFQNCFDVISGSGRDSDGEQLSKNVEFYMTGLLTVVIDEGQALPNGVTDVLLAQFLRADPRVLGGGKRGEIKSDSDVQEILPPYNMAKSVCNTCEETMTRHIGTYFASVLVDAQESTASMKPKKSKTKKRTHDESEDDSDSGLMPQPSDADLEEVAKAHRLLRELWKSCPGLVRNVIPQIEQEVGAENLPLRVLGVETLGDMIAGIGAAGPPLPPSLDPVAYPSQSLGVTPAIVQHNPLMMPAAPHAFSSVYPSTFQAFCDRRNDKAAQVRSAWAIAAGWIVYTSAGGKGLDHDHESSLLKSMSDLLVDQDEKVRLAVIHAIAQFDFATILSKVGSLGGLSVDGSLLANLATRIKDVKPAVGSAAIQLLGRIWGFAAGSIAEGRQRVRDLFGWIPSRILEAVYVNRKDLNAIILRTMFDSLLPIGYPPIKSKSSNGANSQRVIDSQNTEDVAPDPDKLRVERLLVLIRDLEDKAKTVFFALHGKQQASKAKYLEALLEQCDTRKKGKESDEKTERLLNFLVSSFADPSIAAHQLSIFLEHHDRRNFALMGFCVKPESEYRKVLNATRELTKRLEQAPTSVAGCLDTVTIILRQTSYLILNRSHVPALMDMTRRDDKGLATAAHEVLREISTCAPAVFKIHIKDLCESLKKQASSTSSETNVVDSLKTCSGFARHFPKDLGQDREFFKAMVKFATRGSSPRAAKYAVTVVVLSADKREMYIQDILKYGVKGFKYGAEGYLVRLGALCQLRLMANEASETQEDAITEIATNVLRHAVTNGENPESGSEDDDELSAKLLALKIFVNRLRGRAAESPSETSTDDIKEMATRVFRLLNTLIEKEGELSSADSATPTRFRVQLRLAAAKFVLKLCCDKRLSRLFASQDLNRLTTVVQDESAEVRAEFSKTLEKYMNQGKLDARFHALLFVYAFEPVAATKDRTMTFLKARSIHHARLGDNGMERIFGYFLSVLAHHQDFGASAEDLEDFIEYIVFYLRIVATEKNLPSLYNVAQRLKTVEDGIDPSRSENLYVLSDLTEAVIRHFAELQGWSLQILAAKAKLPAGLYNPISNHSVQEISEKNFLPAELVEDLDEKVKKCLKTKKRKSQDAAAKSVKKAKTDKDDDVKATKSRKVQKTSKSAKPTKVAKKSKEADVPLSERRKSSRASNTRNYIENDDSEDDEELERWQADDDADDGDEEEEDEAMENPPEAVHSDADANKENVGSPTPPTSQTIPVEETSAKKASRTSRSRSSTAMVTKQAITAKRKKDAVTKPPRNAGGRTKATRNATSAAKTKTKNKAQAKTEKDEFDFPSDDSEEERSDAPTAMEA